MKVSDIFLLAESKEIITVLARPLNKMEAKLAQEFQGLCSVIHDYIVGDKSKESWTDQHVKELIRSLKKFKRFTFMDHAIKELEDCISAFGKMGQARENMVKHRTKMNKHSDDILAAMLAGDLDKVHDVSTALGALLDQIDAHVDVNEKAKRQMKQTFTRENMGFFSGGSTDIIDIIDGNMYKKIIELDFTSDIFTYTNFPVNKMAENLKYLIAFMLNLSTTDKPKRIDSNDEFRKYLMLSKAGSDSYKTLMDLVQNYLQSNNKTLIPKIMSYIEDHPEIRDANNKAKKKIKTVYRGVPADKDERTISSAKAVLLDKKEKVVATSPSKHAAMNFALQKGHLDSVRRSELGYLIEYEVDFNSIVLVTYILGTAYNEKEILIDASKAKVVQIEEV